MDTSSWVRCMITVAVLWAPTALSGQAVAGLQPGSRVLLDAHNAYPEGGRWSERIERALSTGVPLAIEQDLFWRRDPDSGAFEIVVAHDSSALPGAPTLEHHFFDRIRPIMEQALRDNRRDQWPLVVLNLDFKQNEAPLLDAVWLLLGRYERWLTTAERTATPLVAEPLRIGPLLVLSGSDPRQRLRFHDRVPIGQTLHAFGGIVVSGAPKGLVHASPSSVIAPRADNYARWVNFPWSVVEEGGQTKAEEWTTADSVRLTSLVARAHEQGLWIRFYTLDGFSSAEDRGFTASYNFGSDSAAVLRWKAAIRAGVDFVATDQYERFVGVRDLPH